MHTLTLTRIGLTPYARRHRGHRGRQHADSSAPARPGAPSVRSDYPGLC